MGEMTIRNIQIELDFLEELEPYLDKFEQNRIRDNKLQACSPFRHERRPSFAVNLDNGSWIDSGSTDDSMRKGHFTHLLAFLRVETWWDTEDYLLSKYSTLVKDVDGLELVLDLKHSEVLRTFSRAEIEPYMWRVRYLLDRGITEEVHRLFQIGYDKENKAVMIPWHNSRGEIINMKFRSIRQKRFWYHPEGQRIKQYVYGLHIIIRRGITRVFCTESETDALYLWSQGIPAIAFGGANMSEAQKKLILNSPIEELVVATDNDAVGKKFAERLEKELGGYIVLSRFNFPEKYKDVNDIPSKEIITMVQENVEILSIRMKLRHNFT